MQSDSSSLETLKTTLLSAVDADYNVTNPELVLDIISQLEKIQITRDQLQTTRLGREINTIRQKIDARKKSAKQAGDYPPSVVEIAQRAKKLLRSWQGLLNTSQTDNNSSSSSIPSSQQASIPSPVSVPAATPSTPTVPPILNGDIHESKSPSSEKPRLIVKVKITPPITPNSNADNATQLKRKTDSEVNGVSSKRRKPHVESSSVTSPSPISPSSMIEPPSSSSLPRVKTTQQLLLEMQLTQPDVLSTQTPTVNAILQNQIIDESLHERGKLDYSALHHGRDTTSTSLSNTCQRPLTFSALPNAISPSNSTISTGSSSKRSGPVQRPSSTLLSSTINWENGSSAGGSPVSPSSSSSSSIASTTSWPNSTNIPEPPSSIPVIPKKKRRRKDNESASPSQQQQQQQQPIESLSTEQSSVLSADLATICSSYNTVAELVEAHRRRMEAEHDKRELEARPDLLLVPIEQLAFVYERERTRESKLTPKSKPTKLTTVDKLDQASGLIALPFIDCPLDFDLVLDELVVQQPTMDL